MYSNVLRKPSARFLHSFDSDIFSCWFIIHSCNIMCKQNLVTSICFYIFAGTFQKVDYVFLVGVGGGVPHYTDYSKHVRLGDVVASHPNTPEG